MPCKRRPGHAAPVGLRAMKIPSKPCCHGPHSDCPSHGTKERSSIVCHTRLRTKLGVRRRFLCKVCGRTFVRTFGTVYYRMRKPHGAFDKAVECRPRGSDWLPSRVCNA